MHRVMLEGDAKPDYLRLLAVHEFKLTEAPNASIKKIYTRKFNSGSTSVSILSVSVNDLYKGGLFGIRPLTLFVSAQFNNTSDRNTAFSFAFGSIDSDQLTSEDLKQFIAYGEAVSKVDPR
jgi:hypothetical protein